MPKVQKQCLSLNFAFVMGGGGEAGLENPDINSQRGEGGQKVAEIG